MRTIKFRAWHNTRREMFAVESVNFDHRNGELDSVTLDTGVVWDKIFGLTEVELMQFTGLLDKAGREIYEGDIVHSDHWNCNWEVQWCDGKGEFLRSQVGWILNDEKMCSVGHVQELTAHCEISEPEDREDYFNGHVIGNVHGNPELVRESAK